MSLLWLLQFIWIVTFMVILLANAILPPPPATHSLSRLKDHNAACSLTFATADELECVFRADKERGVFKCGHYYASQSIDHFCWKCILENSDKSKSNSYCVTKVTPSDCKHGSWKAHFVFTYNLPTCVSVSVCSLLQCSTWFGMCRCPAWSLKYGEIYYR